MSLFRWGTEPTRGHRWEESNTAKPAEVHGNLLGGGNLEHVLSRK